MNMLYILDNICNVLLNLLFISTNETKHESLFQSPEVHDCIHRNYNIYTICNSFLFFSPDLSVQLLNGSDATEGRVEMIIKGVHRTVCDDSWDVNDATVVCRMLGFDM